MLNPLITPLMIEKYAKRLVDRIKTPALRGVVLTGSFARGEAGPFSDLDVWCFYNEKVSRKPYFPELTGISLDLRETCIHDFRAKADGTREYVAPYFEQLNVFGETPFILPSHQEIQNGVKKLLFSIEKRLKQLASPNHYEILNDIMYVLRIERYFATSQYPLTLSELYTIQFEECERFLVECFSFYLLGERTIKEEQMRSIIELFLDKRL
ncbi:nucleotidyltransferase domain-containing protein [Pseudalkalibacillus hwajinpoensis]|uniref:nucleotidyltransferase domain-containing protein n=1 Tax=Guptibacillus hwajinpoensis TaxID=208199 RepID=UPI00325A59A7